MSKSLAEYSLADINQYSLLFDFPDDFKNACTSAELDLSLAFTEANSKGDVVSIEDFNLSERLLTATYKFPLTALMANRTISFKAPGNFGLYGYIESMAVSFSNGEKMKEMGPVRLFVACIQNSITFMERDFSEFAEKNQLEDAVREVITEKIAEAKKYYDHAAGVFETIHSEYVAAVNPFAPYTKPGKLKIDSYSNFEISKYTPDKGYPEDFGEVFTEAFDYYHVNKDTLMSIDNADLLEKLILLSDSQETTHRLVHNLSRIHSSAEAAVSTNFLGFLGRFAANPDKKLLPDVVLYIETLRGVIESAVKSYTEQPAFRALHHKWRIYAEWEFENLLAYYKEAEEYFRRGDFSVPKGVPGRTAPFDSKLSDYFYSASHYEMAKIARLDNSRVYDALYRISSELPNEVFWAKSLKERIDAFEKTLILSDASCTKRFSIAYHLYRLLSEEGIIKDDGTVNDFVGTLGEAYNKLYHDSLGTLDDMNRLPAYIIETEEYITGIAYILLRLNFEDTYSVFYANYRGAEPKLGNPPESYIKRLLVYYNELYAGFIRIQNSFMKQYVFNQHRISDAARAKYAAAFGSQPAAVARESAKKPKPAKPVSKPTKQPAKPVSKPAKQPVFYSVEPEESKMLQNISIFKANDIAADASIPDGLKDEFVSELKNLAQKDSANAVDLYEKAIIIDKKSKKKCHDLFSLLNQKLRSDGSITRSGRGSGTAFSGTLNKELTELRKKAQSVPAVGSPLVRITSLIGLLLCIGFIVYIFTHNSDTVQWLGTGNIKKALIAAGLGFITGLLSGGIGNAVVNVIITLPVFTVGAIVTSVLDFSTLAQDRTILTVCALYFGFVCLVFFGDSRPAVIENARKKRADFRFDMDYLINENVAYIDNMLGLIKAGREELLRAHDQNYVDEKVGVSALLSYYTEAKNAFKNIKY